MENSEYEQVSAGFVQNRNVEMLFDIGDDENGKVFTQDLSQIPHFLVCGFSGAGKTSFVQSVMTQLCSEQSPDDVRFVVFDSKGIDYSVFNGVPHMVCPAITDEQKVAGVVLWLNAEVQRRIKTFCDAGTKDFVAYNCKGKNTLPRIFAIFDDFSSANWDIQTIALLTDILKNGRVAGIHCVVVTSLPSSKVLKKDIISNLVCRISFCVSSKAGSRAAIEQNGAESLKVPGEMIFKYQNIFAKYHAAYVPFEDIQAATKSLGMQYGKNDGLGDLEMYLQKRGALQRMNEWDDDEMLQDAVEIVLETGMASVSMLQRRLKVGYARAVRIVDKMEEKGIVGPFEGSKARSILITREQWETM